MALPSQVWAALVGDLLTMGAFATRGQALTSAIPAPGPDLRLAFAWPDMREVPDGAPGGRAIQALVQTTWVVKFAGNTPDQSAGPQGPQPNTESFAQYDVSQRLRQLFYGPCLLRESCVTIVVDEVYVGAPGLANGGATFEGSFALTVHFQTSEFITPRMPTNGPQATA